jgi:hypothetical protein
VHCVLLCCVQLVQHNLVTELQIQPSSLPANDQAPVGQVFTPTVVVTTEDGAPLPWEVVSSSLSLILTMPSAGGGSSSTKAKARPAEIIPLVPDRLASQAAASGDGAEGQQPVKGCVVCFTTPELTVAGSYTMAAEYREGRDDLLPYLGKQVRAQQPLQKMPASCAIHAPASTELHTGLCVVVWRPAHTLGCWDHHSPMKSPAASCCCATSADILQRLTGLLVASSCCRSFACAVPALCWTCFPGSLP